MGTYYEMTGALVPIESFTEVKKLFLNEQLQHFQAITCHSKLQHSRVRENVISKYLFHIHLISLSYLFYHVGFNTG